MGKYPGGQIVATYVANRQGAYGMEKGFAGLLVLGLAVAVFHGVLELGRMQADYSLRCPLGGHLKTGQWSTAENRPMASGPDGFDPLYAAEPSGRKSVPVFVRQLRGPHLRMCA